MLNYFRGVRVRRLSFKPRVELKLFLLSVQFFTRIPMPRWVGHSASDLQKALRYFPMVGWIVGSVTAVAVLLLRPILPIYLVVILASMIGPLVTGAMHEKGLADFVDGFWRGQTRQQILSIMKESKMGVYGVLSLTLILMLRIGCWISLDPSLDKWGWFWLLLSGQAFSRALAQWVTAFLPYVREHSFTKAGRVVYVVGNVDYMVASVGGIVPVWMFMLYFDRERVLFGLLIAVGVFGLLIRLLKKRLQGYTGNCLGAVQQFTEVAFYAGVLLNF